MHKIGGQAVIEGVMMKSTKGWSVVVRDPAGKIHVKKEPLRPLPALFKLPLLRGVIALFHALIIGVQALEFSATMAYDEQEEEPLSKRAIAITVVVSMFMGVGLFILLPLYAAKLIGLVFASVAESSFMFNAVDGVVRVLIFFLYVTLIGLWGEMRRVFEYHGAEHKVIHAYEDGRKLAADNIRDFSTRHPRCGTSFLMIVMFVSILIFSFIPQDWPFIYKFLSRVFLMPLIAGTAYETLKLSAKLHENPIVKVLVWPGLVLQGLTTREPDDEQVEVAVLALEAALEMENDPDA